ncbi:MAG: alpha-amylase [Candidatus Hydrogenedentes bacterium]|nr:alpha-amylase [Candidatus Hydrogenedentota bacterium]
MSGTHGIGGAPVEQRLSELDLGALTAGRSFHPSPASWEDELLYFLLVDRFSDGKEFDGFADADGNPVDMSAPGRVTPLFTPADEGNADWDAWFAAGRDWCGGTLVGLKDKLGYLKRLGVTAVWLSPVFRQVTDSDTYHGYGIQNFLDVDPHLGTREELKELVAAAHAQGIRVILDIILNHAGDVFAYQGGHRYYYSEGRQWPVAGYRSQQGDPGSLPFGPLDPADAWPGGGVWPQEFQDPATWTRKGEIRDGKWDEFPEYSEGDFYTLKDINHGPAPKDPDYAWDLLRRIDEFRPAPAMGYLAQVYKFWIAYADIDGYRIDTVKHMEPGAVRLFANIIHEYAQSLGKERFYLIGEITGGRANAVNVLNTTGLDAALGLGDLPDQLEFLAKGWRCPGDPTTPDAEEGYFDLFRNGLIERKPTHQWFGKHVVSMFDDHDQVGVKHKFRFCGQHADSDRFLPVALALNLLTSGISCIYYGTEQAFDGCDDRSGDDDTNSDVFLRECMFGGPFGSYQSTGRHFFNEDHPAYRLVHDLGELRRDHIALRRGRQYLRQVSGSGFDEDFHYPRPINGELRWVIAWSRLFADDEYLCAINTDPHHALTIWATVDKQVHAPGTKMKCLLSSSADQHGEQMDVEARNGSAVLITVPAAGFVVFG